ncbi:MAG: DUF4199 family protein [Aureispira sp.]|nr:DUF4199 family protein [Aureispira sp.]
MLKHKLSTAHILIQAAKAAIVVALLYCFSVMTAHKFNYIFSPWPLWSFRLGMIISCIAAVFIVRIQQRGYITYPQGILSAVSAALMLGIFISIFTYVFQTSIYPEYQTAHKQIYYRGLELDGWTLEQATKQIEERWNFYFTTKGSMIIDIISSLAWGFMIAITIGYMARRVPEE